MEKEFELFLREKQYVQDVAQNTICDGQVVLDKKLSFDSSVFSL